MESKKYKQVWLCEEDALNLKNAENRILATLDANGGQYEALEVFTIQDIIKQYEGNEE